MIQREDPTYTAACEALGSKDDMYRRLVVRIAQDVSWGACEPDSEYEAGLGASPEPLHRAFARRVIVELGS